MVHCLHHRTQSSQYTVLHRTQPSQYTIVNLHRRTQPLQYNVLHKKVKVKVKSLSPVRLFVTPWTVAYQAPLSMGFSRQ